MTLEAVHQFIKDQADVGLMPEEIHKALLAKGVLDPTAIIRPIIHASRITLMNEHVRDLTRAWLAGLGVSFDEIQLMVPKDEHSAA